MKYKNEIQLTLGLIGILGIAFWGLGHVYHLFGWRF